MEVENLTQAQEKLNADRSELAEKMKRERRQQADAERSLAELQENIRELTDKEIQLKQSTDALDETVKRLKQQKMSLENENDKLASSVVDRTAAASLSGEILALQGEIEGLKKQKRTLQEEVSDVAGRAYVQARQQAEAEYWKGQTKQGQIKALEARKSVLENEIEALQKQKGQLEAAINEGAAQ